MPHLLDVPGTIRWIRRDGIENILAGMVRYLESDLLRWEEFEKVPRLASHSLHGVIELMPTSDGSLYSFKYVNGHPFNPAPPSRPSPPSACSPTSTTATRCSSVR